MAKVFKRHRGVGIFRNKDFVIGSDFRVTDDGRIVHAKPQYTISYGWPDSYPYDTLEEAKKAVDNVLDKAISLNSDVQAMVDELNSVEVGK